MSPDPKLIDKLSTLVNPEAASLLEAVREIAADRGMTVCAVGGTVRDLLLDSVLLDLDLVVEGEVLPLVRAIADRSGARVTKATRFGTATLRSGGAMIDVATARTETYARPGALPTVTPSSLEDDLRRRDFTINSIALALTGADAGKLIDPTGGLTDLGARLIRVIHDRSFQDDATRILRAARYEARLGFQIEAATMELLRRDVAYLQSISAARIHRELQRTMSEDEPERALSRLDELGALGAIQPQLAFDGPALEAAPRLRSLCARARINPVYWPLLCLCVRRNHVPAIARRLALTRRELSVVEDTLVLIKAGRHLAGALKPSEVVGAFDGYAPAAVAAFAAITDSAVARQNAVTYLTRLRYVRAVLRGDDVLALGVRAGPDVGDVLRRLKVAKLDRKVRSREDEEQFVRRYLNLTTTRRR